MPRYGDQVSAGAARSFYVYATSGRNFQTRMLESNSSLLNHCFNHLWCAALNERERGVTDFAMQHSDIEPEPFWLDKLWAEREAVGADVISVVVPIKAHQGTTSTAIDTGDPYHSRRLTMREVMELPETFTAEDVGGPLLLNTGLWLCDFAQPWVEEVCFDSLHRIGKSNGQWKPECCSEDWLMSMAFNRLGLKVAATRKVGVKHLGSFPYPNDSAWGSWATDEHIVTHEKEQLACA